MKTGEGFAEDERRDRKSAFLRATEQKTKTVAGHF